MPSAPSIDDVLAFFTHITDVRDLYIQTQECMIPIDRHLLGSHSKHLQLVCDPSNPYLIDNILPLHNIQDTQLILLLRYCYEATLDTHIPSSSLSTRYLSLLSTWGMGRPADLIKLWAFVSELNTPALQDILQSALCTLLATEFDVEDLVTTLDLVYAHSTSQFFRSEKGMVFRESVLRAAAPGWRRWWQKKKFDKNVRLFARTCLAVANAHTAWLVEIMMALRGDSLGAWIQVFEHEVLEEKDLEKAEMGFGKEECSEEFAGVLFADPGMVLDVYRFLSVGVREDDGESEMPETFEERDKREEWWGMGCHWKGSRTVEWKPGWKSRICHRTRRVLPPLEDVDPLSEAGNFLSANEDNKAQSSLPAAVEAGEYVEDLESVRERSLYAMDEDDLMFSSSNSSPRPHAASPTYKRLQQAPDAFGGLPDCLMPKGRGRLQLGTRYSSSVHSLSTESMLWLIGTSEDDGRTDDLWMALGDYFVYSCGFPGLWI